MTLINQFLIFVKIPQTRNKDLTKCLPSSLICQNTCYNKVVRFEVKYLFSTVSTGRSTGVTRLRYRTLKTPFPTVLTSKMEQESLCKTPFGPRSKPSMSLSDTSTGIYLLCSDCYSWLDTHFTEFSPKKTGSPKVYRFRE